MDVNGSFGCRLTELRNKCGLSQKRLAEMLFVSAQAVSKWETCASMPNIDLLVPLAQILGTSIEYLLDGKEGPVGPGSEVPKDNLLSYDISDKNAWILSRMSRTLTRKQLFTFAKLVENDNLSFDLSLEAVYKENTDIKRFDKKLDIRCLPEHTLECLSKPIADLAIRAVNTSSDPIIEISEILMCPGCSRPLAYYKEEDSSYLSCGTHRYDITDGIVDFGTFEQHGNTWSSWIRSYDDFKAKREAAEPLLINDDLMSEAVFRLKPKVILDIGSGMATSIEMITESIDWPCTIILTDISHRILKYVKRRFDEKEQNPNVNFVYLACDDRHLPVQDGSVNAVTSFGGFENICGVIIAAIGEACRVISDSGYLITEMALVKDRNSNLTKKWLGLIENDPDPDISVFLRQRIFDIDEWKSHFKSLGFKEYDMTLIKDELPPPDTDKFPYGSEIMQWMSWAAVVAVK